MLYLFALATTAQVEGRSPLNSSLTRHPSFMLHFIDALEVAHR